MVTEHLLPLEGRNTRPWQHYLLDSLLAILGTLLVTGIISTFQLYPRIPNISIVYLLVVLPLASARGRYAAAFAAVAAFFAFDFFIVPPVFTFGMYRIEEWIALFVFLFDAILTGHLAASLRQRAQDASRRERETHILYDLMRVTNSQERQENQLQAITQALVDVFSSWGVLDCALLQPDATGVLRVQASAHQPLEQATVSSDEQAAASWVQEHGQGIDLSDDATPLSFEGKPHLHHVTVHSTTAGHVVHNALRLLPLKVGQQVVGVLRLRVRNASQLWPYEDPSEKSSGHPSTRTAFFWTFLDQAASLIERVNLRRENLRIEILQRTDALRAALLSSVSHDLRTPLTSIKAAASSLLQEDVQWDEETRRSFARAIEREADRLNRLVGNLLDMSRIEGGALKPEKEWVSLAKLINDVLSHLQPLLNGRDVQTHLSEDLPPIELDYLQIDQVLTNLLENAVRYTPPESPIEISAQYDGSQMLISVADRGPGIPPADLERVFDKFYRVQRTRQAVGSPSGTGLGLAVSRGVIEAHGGRIWAEPRPGGGVVFFLTLPVTTAEGALT